jgi:hypothetical protein
LCKSQRASKPRRPWRRSETVSLETPNAVPTGPSAPDSTRSEGLAAVLDSAGSLGGDAAPGSKSTAETRFAPRRQGRTPASSRSKSCRSSSSVRSSGGREPLLGLRDTRSIVARHEPDYLVLLACATCLRYLLLLAAAPFSSK